MHKPDGIFGVFEVVKDFYEHGIDEHLWVFQGHGLSMNFRAVDFEKDWSVTRLC